MDASVGQAYLVSRRSMRDERRHEPVVPRFQIRIEEGPDVVPAETALLLEQENRDLRPAPREGEGGKAAGKAATRDHYWCGMSFHERARCRPDAGIAIRPLVHMDRPCGHS